MFRISKADGWNRCKIQKRFLLFFWKNFSSKTYTGKGTAISAAIDLSIKYKSRLKL